MASILCIPNGSKEAPRDDFQITEAAMKNKNGYLCSNLDELVKSLL
jgi:hypothetical protein